MSRFRTPLLWLLSAFFVFAGFNHVMNPEFYVAIMPPNLPAPEWLHLVAGIAELVLGIFLLEPRTRVVAAWGIIALLIAIFPANLYVARENVGIGGPGTGAGAANYVRLPFQALFIVWAWWYTRPDTSR